MSNLVMGSSPLASTGGMYIGIWIGVTVVFVVVVLVVTIISLAHRIATKAKIGEGAMDAATANTMVVWAVRDINRSTTGIWRAAESARKILGG